MVLLYNSFIPFILDESFTNLISPPSREQQMKGSPSWKIKLERAVFKGIFNKTRIAYSSSILYG